MLSEDGCSVVKADPAGSNCPWRAQRSAPSPSTLMGDATASPVATPTPSAAQSRMSSSASPVSASHSEARALAFISPSPPRTAYTVPTAPPPGQVEFPVPPALQAHEKMYATQKMDATHQGLHNRQKIVSEFPDYTVRSQVVGVGLQLAESATLLWVPKSVEVHEVAYGFAAEEDRQIQVGDRVVAIDGKDVQGMELAAIKQVEICKCSNVSTIPQFTSYTITTELTF